MLTIIRTICVAIFAALALTPCLPASAAPIKIYSGKFEYREYIVKKGDTLWSISKAELTDGFMWPVVWQENLRINNPDLIYPGQKILIPVRLLEPPMDHVRPAQEPEMPRRDLTDTSAAVDFPEPELAAPEPMQVEPEPQKADDFAPAPVSSLATAKPMVQPTDNLSLRQANARKAKPFVTRELVLKSGYITKNVPNYGTVTGAPRGRRTFAKFDELYIQTKAPVSRGDQFYVIHKGDLVKHPINNKKLGWLVTTSGTVEALEDGSKRVRAKVIENFDALFVDDLLEPYYEVDLPSDNDDPRLPSIEGNLVAAKQMRFISGKFDVVFLDKGEDEGLEPGDMIMSVVPGTDDLLNSLIRLINIRQTTSLGLVVKSNGEITRGDVVMGLR